MTRVVEQSAMPLAGAPPAPLIAHIVYRLGIGGLETVLTEVINETPPGKYRHAVICLTQYTDFRQRIKRQDVEVYALNKRPGKDLGVWWRAWQLLRKLRPKIVHTYNISTLEMQWVALAAGAKFRIHAEHGRDFSDLNGTNSKYNLLRRLMRPIVSKWVPVSKDLHGWLKTTVGISDAKNSLIFNGIDTARFYPATTRQPLPDVAVVEGLVIGAVGRVDPVKDQLSLLKAFALLKDSDPALTAKVRVAIIGDGPLIDELREFVRKAKLEDCVWLAGARNDVADMLRAMDLFVLPSLAEGIPLTVLEAMASGLPVIASNVGGNKEVILDGITGKLIPPANPRLLAEALKEYLSNPQRMREQGLAGRQRVVENFSRNKMVAQYLALYDDVIKRK